MLTEADVRKFTSCQYSWELTPEMLTSVNLFLIYCVLEDFGKISVTKAMCLKLICKVKTQADNIIFLFLLSKFRFLLSTNAKCKIVQCFSVHT